MNPFHTIKERNHKNENKSIGLDAVKNDHLPRGQRHVIQINKKYYFEFRKLAFKHPGTNITQWADRALAYSFKRGPIKEWLNKLD